MRWRSSAVYLLILLLLVGYYYYFEVLKKEEQKAVEKEARKVLVFQPDKVTGIEIYSGDAQPIRLEKQDQWKITEPVNTDVDRTSFDGLFGGLKNLESERKVTTAAPENLAPYGLAKPPLKVRLHAGDQWLELLVGEQNPTGDSRYAKLASAPDIFLIPQGNWNVLNKTVKDLRKKELFSWQTSEVVGMDVGWQSGEKYRMERGPENREWQAVGKPELKLKTSKVENVLDQLHWMRATDFLDDGAAPAPPLVEVTLQLKNGRTAQLKLGEADPKTKQAVASSSEISVPVRVAGFVTNEIPKSADSLVDRSLIASDVTDIRKVQWKTEGDEGVLTWMDQENWGTMHDNKLAPIKEPWMVISFLEQVASTEYTAKTEPGAAPDPLANRVEFSDAQNRTGAIAWAKLATPGENAGPVAVRLEKNGETGTVQVQYNAILQMQQALDSMVKAGKEKK